MCCATNVCFAGEHLPIPTSYSPDLRDLTKQLLSRVPTKRPSPEVILKLPWLKVRCTRGNRNMLHGKEGSLNMCRFGSLSRQLYCSCLFLLLLLNPSA